MRISTKDWVNFREKLSKLNKEAAEKMTEFVQKRGFGDPDLIEYAYGLVTKYGEGSAALSALMYDAVAEMEGKTLPAAVPAPTPDKNEVAKMVNGVKKWSKKPESLGNAVGRMVKRTGADTTLRNARRDGAEFAWVPHGDTCAFCIALASRGWQHISKSALKNGHAEHIHANCDCTYAIRFSPKTSVAGYNPDKYKEMYDSAEGNTPEEKIRYMRREREAEKKSLKNKGLDSIIKDNKGFINLDLQLFAEKSLEQQGERQLRKGIKSLQQDVERHKDYIKNPKQKWKDWDLFSEERKQRELKHWEKEIEAFEDSIKNRIEMLKKRGLWNE